MAQRETKVLHDWAFRPEDPRWGGQVQVVRSKQVLPDGTTREYVDVLLWVGDRFLNLPRRSLQEISRLIAAADAPAQEAYEDLVREMNRGRTFPADPAAGVPVQHRKKQGRRTRHEEEDE